MKRLLLCLALVLSGLGCDAASLMERIAQKYSVDAFSFSFTQIRHSDLLTEDLVSEGRLHFEKPDRVTLELLSPEAKTLHFNGSDAKGARKNMARYLQKATSQEDLASSFEVQEADGQVILTPKIPELKRLFSRLTLYALPDGTLTRILLEDAYGYTRLELRS